MLKPCKKCGATDRNNSGDCRPCSKESKRIYLLNNPEKRKETTAKYRENNAIKVRAASLTYYYKNKEISLISRREWKVKNKDRISDVAAKRYQDQRDKILTYNKQWLKDNKIKARTYCSKRRVKILNNGGNFTKTDIDNLYKLQNATCVICRESIKSEFHIDHITPVKSGGSNDKYNIQLLCKQCNMKKSAKDPIKFMQQRGYLL